MSNFIKIFNNLARPTQTLLNTQTDSIHQILSQIISQQGNNQNKETIMGQSIVDPNYYNTSTSPTTAGSYKCQNQLKFQTNSLRMPLTYLSFDHYNHYAQHYGNGNQQSFGKKSIGEQESFTSENTIQSFTNDQESAASVGYQAYDSQQSLGLNNMDYYYTPDPTEIQAEYEEPISFSGKSQYAESINQQYEIDEKNKIINDFRQKYKTEICKNWQLTGECLFKDQCSFAHGVDELNERVHVPKNYKTKLCKRFHIDMYCPYGPRCQFIHNEKSNESLTKKIEAVEVDQKQAASSSSQTHNAKILNNYIGQDDIQQIKEAINNTTRTDIKGERKRLQIFEKITFTKGKNNTKHNRKISNQLDQSNKPTPFSKQQQ